ncbi:MAG: C-terminal target protein, partial [Cytophagaceae bacterium]|nr:C-terminal target protein [Cytophagaceae bacterium]
MNDRIGKVYTGVVKALLGIMAVVVLFSGQDANAQCFPASSGVSVIYDITPPTCNGATTGSVSVIVSGGGAPYTFTIAGSTISFQSITQAGDTYTFTNLPSDPSFFISVQTKITTGFAVCNFAGLSISEPAPITATPDQDNVTCNGDNDGTASITAVAGGVAPYTY